MIKDLIIIGAGNPDIVRLIEDINLENKTFNFIGFTDIDKNKIGKEFYGYPIIGSDDILDDVSFKNCSIINNIYASQSLRRELNQKLLKYHHRFCNLIHPTVLKGRSKIGLGNIIFDGVIIQAGVTVGNGNILHSNTIISHETEIGNNCLFSVNVSIGSRSKVGDYCFFGISSTTFPGLIIDKFSYIGGGSVVYSHLKEKSKVFGNPARHLPNK